MAVVPILFGGWRILVWGTSVVYTHWEVYSMGSLFGLMNQRDCEWLFLVSTKHIRKSLYSLENIKISGNVEKWGY